MIKRLILGIIIIGLISTSMIGITSGEPYQSFVDLIHEDEYEAHEILLNQNDTLRYEIDVTSGPSIDVFLLNYEAYQDYLFEVTGGEIGFTGIDIQTKIKDYYSETFTITEPGTYYLILDNTNVKTDPPSDNVDSEVVIEVDIYLNDEDSINMISVPLIIVLFVSIGILFSIRRQNK